LNQRLLLIGTLAYGGVVALSLIRQYVVFIPVTILVALLSPLTTIGIAATVFGMLGRGTAHIYHTGSLMVSGSILGIVGLWDQFLANFDYDKAVDVCQYSKVVPGDAQAQWACPEVEASYYIMWILLFSLIIPSLLFFVIPFLSLRQGHRRSQVSEQPNLAK